MARCHGWLRVLVVLVVFRLSCSENLYKVLGIARDATEREIKRSYRRLALALHPDKLGPNATEAQKQRFISINQAYEVLSDESQRKRYDEIGEALFSAPVQVAKQYGEDPFDMFISFKRGGFRFRYTKKVQRQAAAVVLGAELTLEELLHEHEVTMVTERSVTCSHCHGTGAAGPEHVHTCGVCHGDGRLSHLGYAGEAYRHVVRTKCPVCGGWGRTITDACPVCKGTHVVPEPVSYTFKVPAGAKDGHEVVLRGSGNHAFLQKVGDAVLVIKRTPHPIFRDEESDLEMTLAISLFEALTGFNKTVRLLNGSTTEVSRHNKITLTGSSVLIPGAGLPIAQEEAPMMMGGATIKLDPGAHADGEGEQAPKGNLAVVFRVLAPTPLTEAQKAELFRVLGPDKLKLLEALMRVTALREAALAGESMLIEETRVSSHCMIDDPFSCPNEPDFRLQWALLHPQCTRLADNGVDLEVWGPYCDHIVITDTSQEPPEQHWQQPSGQMNATEASIDEVLAGVGLGSTVSGLQNSSQVTQ